MFYTHPFVSFADKQGSIKISKFSVKFDMFCLHQSKQNVSSLKQSQRQQATCCGWCLLKKKNSLTPKSLYFVSLQAWRTWRPSPAPPAESSSRRRRYSPGPAVGREGSPHFHSRHAVDTDKQRLASSHASRQVGSMLYTKWCNPVTL